MKKTVKIVCFIISALVLIIIVSARIVYINSVNYKISSKKVANATDKIEYNGIDISVSEYKIYSGEELNNLYNNELTDIVDKFDILFNVTLTNHTDNIQQFNAIASGIMYGYNSGGNANPYLYQFFNPNTKGIIELQSNESKNITLAFPYEEYEDSIDYIISLYPDNIRVKLR